MPAYVDFLLISSRFQGCETQVFILRALAGMKQWENIEAEDRSYENTTAGVQA